MPPRFYLLLHDLALLEPMLRLGVQWIQWRVKDTDLMLVRQQLMIAQTLCAQHNATLIVNDYWQLALELGIKHVHLGQEDLTQANIAALQHAGIALGISTHTPNELTRALAFNPAYIALGPIYATQLKVMPYAPQGLARITHWKQRLGNIPLVAIGGLTPQRAPQVWQAGANSAAVVTDVLWHKNPLQRAAQWLEVAHATL